MKIADKESELRKFNAKEMRETEDILQWNLSRRNGPKKKKKQQEKKKKKKQK